MQRDASGGVRERRPFVCGEGGACCCCCCCSRCHHPLLPALVFGLWAQWVQCVPQRVRVGGGVEGARGQEAPVGAHGSGRVWPVGTPPPPL
jgi:hypothetical protein